MFQVFDKKKSNTFFMNALLVFCTIAFIKALKDHHWFRSGSHSFGYSPLKNHDSESLSGHESHGFLSRSFSNHRPERLNSNNQRGPHLMLEADGHWGNKHRMHHQQIPHSMHSDDPRYTRLNYHKGGHHETEDFQEYKNNRELRNDIVHGEELERLNGHDNLRMNHHYIKHHGASPAKILQELNEHSDGSESPIYDQRYMDNLRSKRQRLVLPKGSKSASSGRDFLITDETSENIAGLGYKRYFRNSKAYMIESREKVDISVNLLSTVEDYLPQFSIFKYNRDSRTFEMAKPISDSKDSVNMYEIERCNIYIIEVGYDPTFSPDQFGNLIRNGGFVLLISLNSRSTLDFFIKPRLTVSKYKGRLPIKEGKPILLSASWLSNLDHGKLNTKITPYFNKKKGSITIYYNEGSQAYGTVKRRSSIRQICTERPNKKRPIQGREPITGHYEWDVESRRMCKFTYLMSSFT